MIIRTQSPEDWRGRQLFSTGPKAKQGEEDHNNETQPYGGGGYGVAHKVSREGRKKEGP